MENPGTITTSPVTTRPRLHEASGSAVSWAAVIAGAVIAAALSLMLLSGGAGLGFASMSPWAGDGASATTLGIAAIVWMIVTQIISYGVGGYVAGRLRTRWVDVHSDEVYFRDTAHGFLVWALSAVVSAFMVGSAISSVASGAAKVGASAAQGATTAIASSAGAAAEESGFSTEMLVDRMFRTEQPAPTGDPQQARAEVGRILSAGLRDGDVSPEDRRYVAQVVAAQTGVDQPTAEARVNETIDNTRKAMDEAKQTAQEAADAARKAAAAFSLWAFASLLIGAFVASWMATVGGRSAREL